MGQVQMGVARIEQALGVAHHSPVNLKDIRKHQPQDAGDQDAQERAPHRGGAPPVKTVDQGDNQHREKQRNAQPHPDGIIPLEVEGDQHLPQRQHRQGKRGNGPKAGTPGKQD